MLALWIGGCCHSPSSCSSCLSSSSFHFSTEGLSRLLCLWLAPTLALPLVAPDSSCCPAAASSRSPRHPPQPPAVLGMRPGPSGSTGWASGWRGASSRHALAARPVLRTRWCRRTQSPSARQCLGYPSRGLYAPSGTWGCSIEPGFVCFSGQAAWSSCFPALLSAVRCPASFLSPPPVLSVVALIPPDAQHTAREAQGPPLARSSQCHLNTFGCLDATAMRVLLRGAGAVRLDPMCWTPFLGINPRASQLPGAQPGYGHRLSLHRAESETCPVSSDVPLLLVEAPGADPAPGWSILQTCVARGMWGRDMVPARVTSQCPLCRGPSPGNLTPQSTMRQ